uniref:MutS-related protein n=1 Tax=Acetatifactor sp. TaxID=1872090 RepID=UPI004057AA79
MEYIVLFAALGLFFLIAFIREAIEAKKKEKRFIQSLYHLCESTPEKEYSLERYARMGSFYEKHKVPGQIDDITWNDLSMDDIFKRMNYTFSASGEEYLYYTLRNTIKTEEELEHLEDVIQFFREHTDERVRMQYKMHRLGYTGKFSLYDYIDHLDYLGKRSNRKAIFLNILFLPLIGLIFIKPSIAFMGIAVLGVYNIVTYFKEKNEIEPYITSFAYVNRLIVACEEVLKISVPVCEQEYQEMKVHLKALGGVRKGSFWVFTSNQGMTGGNPLDIIMDYIRMMLHIDLIQFNKMLSELRKHIKDVDRLIEIVGFLETAIAIGVFRDSSKDVCVPKFRGEQMIVKDAYHPLLTNPVKNSITASKGVLITGSNASGKSTFLKTMAINTILAQTIHTCCASLYQAPFYEIYSSMSLHDDIGSGESYYIVEIKALKRILDAVVSSEKRILCFVDEVLRGTNTVERIAASTQILKSLTEAGTSLCFAATHDIELTELLKEDYENYHFEEDIMEGDIFFPYLLMEGPTKTRNAIKLLEIMGYQESVISSAMNQAERFVKSGVWSVET